jgi:hypothetical protein
VHFVIDDAHAAALAEQWRELGLQRVPLELVACSDRRLTRSAVECVARELADRQTEVSVLLPERKYKGIWHRILHDRTGDAIQEQVSHLAHANVTSVPFHFGSRAEEVASRQLTGVTAAPTIAPPRPALPNGNGSSTGPAALAGTVAIIDARWRRRVTVGGRVRSVRVAPLHDSPTLEVVLVDATGAISLVFLGRREIAGIGVGTVMTAEGVVGIHQARLAILNPTYRLMD